MGSSPTRLWRETSLVLEVEEEGGDRGMLGKLVAAGAERREVEAKDLAEGANAKESTEDMA